MDSTESIEVSYDAGIDVGVYVFELELVTAFAGSAASGVTGFTYTQVSAQSVWTINHNLGYRPSCELRDAGGNVYEADVQHPNLTQTIVTHAQPMAGSAWLI